MVTVFPLQAQAGVSTRDPIKADLSAGTAHGLGVCGFGAGNDPIFGSPPRLLQRVSNLPPTQSILPEFRKRR